MLKKIKLPKGWIFMDKIAVSYYVDKSDYKEFVHDINVLYKEKVILACITEKHRFESKIFNEKVVN
jgi:hypothetical protein